MTGTMAGKLAVGLWEQALLRRLRGPQAKAGVGQGDWRVTHGS